MTDIVTGWTDCRLENWTYTSQLFGYERIANPTLVNLMNQIYSFRFGVLIKITSAPA